MRTSVGRRAALWLPPLFYMVAIFHFSSESAPLPVLTEHVWDKLLHSVEYAGLGVLVCRALLGEGVRFVQAIVLAALIGGTYGATDEWHQSYVPLRSSDLRDWYTDNLGAGVGAGCYAAALAYFGRHQHRSPGRPDQA